MPELSLDVIAALGLLVLVVLLIHGGPLSGVTDTAPENDSALRDEEPPPPRQSDPPH